MDSLYQYQIFDYQLISDVLLPELLKTDGFRSYYPAGRSITFEMQSTGTSDMLDIEWFHEWKTPAGDTSIVCGRDSESFLLQFPQIALFQIYPGSLNIVCFPYTTNLPVIRHMLLDQVIPRLLFHCGELVIHGSAIMAHDSCLIFLGSTGQGKSTLAIAMCTKGHPILSDDCLLLRARDNKIMVLSNYCGARLLAESVEQLVSSEHNQSGWGKTRLDFKAEGFEYVSGVEGSKIQLFLLEDAEKTASFGISRVSGGRKAAELLKHCFYLDTTDVRCHAVQFANIMCLLKKDGVSMVTLKYPRVYSQLPSICRKIIECSRMV